MKYVMVTNWLNHWDKLKNNRTVFSKNMILTGYDASKIVDGTETIFIKTDRDGVNIEKCWTGRVHNLVEGEWKQKKSIYFSVAVENEIQCPEKYLKYPSGWFIEEIQSL